MSEHYYHTQDLPKFGEIGDQAPDLAAKFFSWYNAVFQEGALSEREKALIALAVAHAVQCPYCIDAYSEACLEKGSDPEQMIEAVHVASAIRGGASLVHGVQMKNHLGSWAWDDADAKGGLPDGEGCSWSGYRSVAVSRALPTLQKRGAFLASPQVQREVLNDLDLARSFPEALQDSGLMPFRALGITVLQINVGKKCNQTCRHCHVDAGPDRKEVMPDQVVDSVLAVLENTEIPTLDITGGAPELHPRFREIVVRARALERHVIDRCNLTILTSPRFDDLPEFLAKHRVEIVASLPHFSEGQTDAQRGEGIFEKSILALRRLNALGYGEEGSGLVLNLVTNPVGAFLPARQEALERDWKGEMDRRYGIGFNGLFTITNMPISRFLEYLQESENLDRYMNRLEGAFNPIAAASVMCRYTLSVGWDGALFDCDFNQMLDLPVEAGTPQTILEFDKALLENREINLGPHCFGCTAGQGSSCGGATSD